MNSVETRSSMEKSSWHKLADTPGAARKQTWSVHTDGVLALRWTCPRCHISPVPRPGQGRLNRHTALVSSVSTVARVCPQSCSVRSAAWGAALLHQMPTFGAVRAAFPLAGCVVADLAPLPVLQPRVKHLLKLNHVVSNLVRFLDPRWGCGCRFVQEGVVLTGWPQKSYQEGCKLFSKLL